MFLFQQSSYVKLGTAYNEMTQEQIANVNVKTVRALVNSDQISDSAKKGVNLPELEKLLTLKKFDEVNKLVNDWVNRFNLRDIFETEFRNILELESKVLTDTKKIDPGTKQSQQKR